MDFTFLGTSAGTPTKARNVTALALQHGGPKRWYLIDCGEGTQHQILHTHYSLMQLQAIFITHVHGDHSFGLPGLLASASMAGRAEPLPIIAPTRLRAFIETAIEQTDSNLGYELQFIDSETDAFRWQDHAFDVTTDAIEPGPIWGQLQQGLDVTLENGETLCSKDYATVTRQPRRIPGSRQPWRPCIIAGLKLPL